MAIPEPAPDLKVVAGLEPARHAVTLLQSQGSMPQIQGWTSLGLSHIPRYVKLALLCRRHHRAKQAPNWRLEQTQPGQVTWQFPHGRSYSTVSGPYRM
jgi:hypothetical protein